MHQSFNIYTVYSAWKVILWHLLLNLKLFVFCYTLCFLTKAAWEIWKEKGHMFSIGIFLSGGSGDTVEEKVWCVGAWWQDCCFLVPGGDQLWSLGQATILWQPSRSGHCLSGTSWSKCTQSFSPLRCPIYPTHPQQGKVESLLHMFKFGVSGVWYFICYLVIWSQQSSGLKMAIITQQFEKFSSAL